MRMEESGSEMKMYDCLVCRRAFQIGPHVYDGRWIAQWNASVCNSCIKMNWDGVVPSVRPHVIEHLEAEKIDYELNDKGRLDIPV